MAGKYLRLMALMGLCACLSSCSLLPQEEVVRTAPMLYAAPPETYDLIPVQRGDLIQTEKITARYVPVQEESLAFRLTEEYVDCVLVNVGDYVEKDQLLAQLRVDDIEKSIDGAQDAIRELDLRLTYLEQEYALALRRHAVETEGQPIEAVQKALHALEQRFDEQRLSIENQKTLQQLTLEELGSRLLQRQIRAPFAGTVTYVREFEEGHLSQYAETVVTIADSTMTVFRADTKNWPLLREGESYTISINGEEHVLEVVSEKTLGIPEENKKEGQKAHVYFRMTEPISGLEDDDNGVIEIELNRRENVLYVPSNAVMPAGDIHIVYCVLDSGIKGYKEVQVGAVIGKYTEITDGLFEGEEIIAG